VSLLAAVNPLYTVSGFAVGLLVGLTGVGGGSLMTPLLVLLFGIQPHTAVGTDLLYAALTKAGGTLVHGRNRTVDWTVVRRLAAGSIPATILTILAIDYFKPASTSSSLISTALGIALLLTAISIVFRRQILDRAAAGVGELSPAAARRATVAVGAALGVLVSLSSVGAGALGVTALIFLYPKIPLARIVGSDIAHAVPLTAIAGMGHWWLGDVDLVLLVSLLLGSLPGIFVGSHLTARVPELVLRPLLAAVLVLVGAKLLLQAPLPPAEHVAAERHAAVGERLGHVDPADRAAVLEIGEGAGDAQHAVVAAGR
jgi:hypothetical protein